jgi:hypothetical protein
MNYIPTRISLKRKLEDDDSKKLWLSPNEI